MSRIPPSWRICAALLWRHLSHGHAAPLRQTKHGRARALGNGAGSAPFTPSDFVVFKSIAEQSAFALYNAIIYSEANEKKRLDHDLEIAREIQRILLPSEAPVIAGFEISGINIPARQVSGDYFDYITVDDDRLGVAIADVSGKGVPASLIMAMCRSVLRSQAAGQSFAGRCAAKGEPAALSRHQGGHVHQHGLRDSRSCAQAVTLSRAGHDAPLLYQRATESVTPIKPPGMAVGIDSGSVFDRITGDFALPLERDDCLILYTDGVTEALDAKRRRIWHRPHDRMRSGQRAERRAGDHHPADRRPAELRRSAAAERRHHFDCYSQNMRRIPVTESPAEKTSPRKIPQPRSRYRSHPAPSPAAVRSGRG